MTLTSMLLLLLVLCSGFPHVTSARRLRYFSRYCKQGNQAGTLAEGTEKCPERWSKNNASSFCQSLNSSIVTLFDEDDSLFINKLTPIYNSVWLGLSKPREPNRTWSDHQPFTYSWLGGNVDELRPCVAMENNKWRAFKCAEEKAFMCSKGPNYILVQHEPKNWCQALHHCRKHFGDLASIINHTQEGLVIEEGRNTSFWIGLLQDEWEWENKTCSTFREERRGGSGEKCTKQHYESLPSKSSCNNVNELICSEGTVRIVSSKEERTWEQANEHCRAKHSGLLWMEEQRDQQAVEQWLQNTNSTNQAYWIGLRQSRLFGFWFWTSDRFAGGYTNWRNSSAPEPSLSKLCGVIDRGTFTWREEDCERQLPFLCEEEIVFMT